MRLSGPARHCHCVSICFSVSATNFGSAARLTSCGSSRSSLSGRSDKPSAVVMFRPLTSPWRDPAAIAPSPSGKTICFRSALIAAPVGLSSPCQRRRGSRFAWVETANGAKYSG